MRHKGYDREYVDLIKNFRDPKCKHPDLAGYDMKMRGDKITAVQHVCTRCGRISQWGKTTGHTVGGAFEVAIKF
jgi:hypothetical protein